MRTSATCRTTVDRGFTLLELTIVLALLGLVAALALPNLERLYGAFTRQAERDRIVDEFRALSHRAVAARRAYAIFDPNGTDTTRYADYAPYAIDLPPGWTLTVKRPVRVRANGFCLGGEVALAHIDGETIDLVLTPPFCRLAGAD